MANKTTNYNLTKPLPEEFYDINVHNDNMDIIDAELKKRVSLNDDGKIPAEQLPEITSAMSTKATLVVNGWTIGEDDRYYQTIAVEGVTTDTKIVLVDVDLSTDDSDVKVARLEAWGTVSANEVDQGNGTLKFYAWEVPNVNIPVNVGVM